MIWLGALNFLIYILMFAVIVGVVMIEDQPSMSIRRNEPSLKKLAFTIMGVIFLTWNALVGIIYNFIWVCEVINTVYSWIIG